MEGDEESIGKLLHKRAKLIQDDKPDIETIEVLPKKPKKLTKCPKLEPPDTSNHVKNNNKRKSTPKLMEQTTRLSPSDLHESSRH